MQGRQNINALRVRTEMAAQGFSFPHRVLSKRHASRLLTGLRASRTAAASTGDLGAMFGVMKPHLLFEWADELAHADPILNLAEAALGPKLILWSMDVFARGPAAATPDDMTIAPRGFEWHQDSTYSCLSPASRVVRIWVALTKTRPENGTLRYLPGSHLLGDLTHALAEHGADKSRGERVQIEIDEGKAVAVVLEPGECTMHDLRTVHESNINRTDRERIAVALTFASADVRPRRPDSALVVRGDAADCHFMLEERLRTDDGAARMSSYLRAIQTRLSALDFTGT
ncbi:phytanoyl-CoA dioxygenase family protein [Mesorhizobium mediterraneum]|uniref:phytanoyl-CoA dioxygenase family protein n=1 Tax=Mesorhizobium mediterraneum TaxID=43617 RepID=UPI00177CDEF1|nr:phytanoyl-CoA dioxygenase family protein [Mesorhizobium mediterraneum]